MPETSALSRTRWAAPALTALAAVFGLGLLVDGLARTSATYDEVQYLEIAARWWRTGEQEAITRMGSPLTFWKLQQAPVLWALDLAGRGGWIDDPIRNQARLLPWARLGGLWIWLVALGATAAWSRRLNGPAGMAAAAWWFALSPNLLAHAGLITMELPLVAAWTLSWFCFWRFLESGRRGWFAASAGAAGIAFSCKFTTILLPPLLGLAWLAHLLLGGEAEGALRARFRPRLLARSVFRVAVGMTVFGLLLLVADLLVTGFATITPSPRTGPHPSLDGRWGEPWDAIARGVVESRWPQDWVGLANQIRHQKSGGWSYLLGERRQQGWWYYYFVALGVKAPLSLPLVTLARLCLRSRDAAGRDAARFLLVGIAGLLAVTALGSSRNYGVRYLFPIAPMAIIWFCGLARGPGWSRGILALGLLGQGVAVASIHPHELSYFNVLAGGPAGGRAWLADSNLDWGQGARDLARLQSEHPELRSITVYYFGDTSPDYYGVEGVIHVIDAHEDHPGLPARLEAETDYIAVSSSLQFGPWGPAGYFGRLEGVEPAHLLPDASMAVYRSADLRAE
jgi:hypothetical protein